MTSAPEGSKQHRLAYWAWIAVCIAWGTTYLATRIAIESYPPLVMAGTRHVLAGCLLAAFVAGRGIALPSRSSWRMHALVGALMIGAGNGFLVWAQQFVPSGAAAAMVSVVPFWMVGAEALMPDGERMHVRQVVGLLIGFGGIVLLTSANIKPEGVPVRWFLLGVVALQCSCCAWAIGSAYAKRHARHESALAATALQMFLGGLVLVAAGTMGGEWSGVHYTLRSTLAVLYLLVVGSFVGYISYMYALKYLPTSTVSLYAYANPVIAVLLGTMVMNEPFTARMAAAIGIIFAAMLIVRRASDTSRN